MTSGTYGPNSPACFASFDRDLRCWRTSQATFLSASETCSVTWPKSGTTRNGRAYARPTWAPCTDANGSLRSRGWPTATVGDSRSSGSRNTPDSKAHAGTSLTDAVRGDGGRGRTWPTPDAALFNDGQTIEAWQARNAKERAKGYNGNGGGVPLAMRARLEEPTRPALRLNPSWVEALMGFPSDWTLPPPGADQCPWEAPRLVENAPDRTARLRALGNAVVPQVAALVGRKLLEIAEREGLL